MRVNPIQPQVQQIQEIDKHMICVVDRSSSMQGSKTTAADIFVLKSFQTAKEEGFKTFTVVEFSTRATKSKTWHTNEVFNWYAEHTGGCTPLYFTLAEYLPKYLKLKGKVLVNVISDGENTEGGVEKGRKSIQDFIASEQTLTFICTESDAKNFIDFGIPETNIQTYNNTGEGLAQTYEVFRGAVQNYSKLVSLGQDVTRGFYSKTIKTN